jgi:hypothetical protein
MFWKKEKPESSIAVAEELKPEPVLSLDIPSSHEVKPDLSAEEFTEYQRVASAIGLDTQEAIFNERMQHCCAINGFRRYDGVQVENFLHSKLGKGKWEWMGLRICDVEHLGGWVSTTTVPHVPFSRKQYGRKVPLPVLLTVQRVLEEVPDAHFYISGIPGVDDDPFLKVTRQNGNSFIIERWDEPDFREVQNNERKQ